MSGKCARRLRKNKSFSKKALAACAGLCFSCAPVNAGGDFLVSLYFIFDSMKEIKTKTVILLCFFSPLIFSGLYCWYIYMLVAIMEIKKYTKLLSKSDLKTCE